MIYLERFDWLKDKTVRFRANDREVQKFVNFMLNSKAWHDDLELIHKKVREFRRKVEIAKPEETREGAQAEA